MIKFIGTPKLNLIAMAGYGFTLLSIHDGYYVVAFLIAIVTGIVSEGVRRHVEAV